MYHCIRSRYILVMMLVCACRVKHHPVTKYRTGAKALPYVDERLGVREDFFPCHDSVRSRERLHYSACMLGLPAFRSSFNNARCRLYATFLSRCQAMDCVVLTWDEQASRAGRYVFCVTNVEYVWQWTRF